MDLAAPGLGEALGEALRHAVTTVDEDGPYDRAGHVPVDLGLEAVRGNVGGEQRRRIADLVARSDVEDGEFRIVGQPQPEGVDVDGLLDGGGLVDR
ncbi:hypothetical protein P3H15_41810 [Rhodococcus sp. T2V]|uniref:hypothetical protein n=1 Tax=Rhodococcus sp. T2V TaxID=3034164 RepID=UPI0023E1612B|nr:hypothetical protein [Rhodococcus sp. T2V]MDF3311525.1 hypothetical protein [Rhodococcus sp. T2V]